jgi:hypothetical protein
MITSFSSGGPTAFGHELKPDVSAPGGQILSSTLPNTDSSRFAVFDGTSMATPHVAGAAALLLELHRTWTPAQVKSALVTTAGPAWGDTARTREAPVPLEGGGLVSLPGATDPQLFTAPTSLSFQDVAPGGSRSLLVQVSDAGDGAGTWTVQLAPQAATTGTAVDVAGLAVVPPGGATQLSVTARVAAGAPTGENYGFVVLRNGATTRRIPYFFLADNPQLALATTHPLQTSQRGTTKSGANHVTVYRYPAAPFGNQPDSPAMTEDGAEVVYATTLTKKAVNAGVAVISKSSGAQIDPWFLGAKDENSVQGFAGTPVDVNELTYDYQSAVGAAGAEYPGPGTYYVAVDSGRGRFDGRSLAGSFVLRSWVDDVTPPTLRLLTTRVTAGRPTIVFRSLDTQSGVDPASLTLGYDGTLLAVGSYDPTTGLAVFPLPASVPALKAGTTSLRMLSSDFQETKNVDTSGRSLMPNTRTASAKLRVVAGMTVDWLLPIGCSTRTPTVAVTAGGPRKIARVVFRVDGKRRAMTSVSRGGVWSAKLRLTGGKHVLTATAVDVAGRVASARRMVPPCNASR